MEQKIAILHHKYQLADDFFLLVPEKAIRGTIQGLTGKFITDTNVSYPCMEDKDNLERKDYSLLYGIVENLQDSIESFHDITGDYPAEENMEEIIEDFFQEFEGEITIFQILEQEDSIRSFVFQLDTISSFLDCLEEVDEQGELLHSILVKDTLKERETSKLPGNQKPILSKPEQIDIQELEDYINERVIGHREQIEDIATILVNNQLTDDPQEIQRILVAGPTGIGKTQTFKAISEYLNIPFLNFATTTLSDTGLVGNDIDDIIKAILFNANNDPEKAKRAIIILDEIDKLAIGSNESSQISVQQNLLKLLEGHTFHLKDKWDNLTKLNTQFMSLVGCGSFPSLFENDKKIGFGHDDSTSPIKVPTLEEFLKFGMIPEFMGRMDQIEVFYNLTEEERYLALTQSKISPFLVKQAQLEKRSHLQLTAEESYFQAILDTTKDSTIGLRSVKNAVNRSLLKVENQILKHPGMYKEAVLSEETVKDNRQYILRK